MRPRICGPCVAGSRPNRRSVPEVTGRDARDHAHRAALAGAVGAEEAEHLAGLHLHVDAVDGGELAEAFDELVGDDQRFGHAGWTVAPDVRPRTVNSMVATSASLNSRSARAARGRERAPPDGGALRTCRVRAALSRPGAAGAAAGSCPGAAAEAAGCRHPCWSTGATELALHLVDVLQVVQVATGLLEHRGRRRTAHAAAAMTARYRPNDAIDLMPSSGASSSPMSSLSNGEQCGQPPTARNAMREAWEPARRRQAGSAAQRRRGGAMPTGCPRGSRCRPRRCRV